MENHYAEELCFQFWSELRADRLAPAVAYMAIDSCFHHPSGVVAYWLRNPLPSVSEGNEDILAKELLRYLVEMRRRALKVRLEWPEKRHEWTNQINRAKLYAEKFL